MDLDALDDLLVPLGDRWSMLLLAALSSGTRTFAELEGVRGISPAVLSARLKTLEAAGYVEAVAYQDRPARYRYGLTRDGESVMPVLRLLAHLGGDAVAHDRCGTHATSAWWCPTCDAPVDPDHADVVRL